MFKNYARLDLIFDESAASYIIDKKCKQDPIINSRVQQVHNEID